MKRLLILIVALLIAGNTIAQKEKLELKLVKGETYQQIMATDMSMIQTVQGQEMNIKIGMNAKMSFQVLDKIDTIYQVNCKYESISMKMDMPTGAMEFNSESTAESDILSKLMAVMKKNPFIIKLSKSGKVLAVSGTEKLFDGFADIAGANAAQLEQMKAQLSQSFGEKALRANLELSMAIYPSKAVQIGDQWQIKGSIQSGMQADVATIYTLKEVTDQYYIISGSSTITSGDGTMETNGMQMKYNLKGDMKSDLKINKKTGWVADSTMEQHIKGSSEILPGGAIPDGMTIPMDMTSKIRVRDGK